MTQCCSRLGNMPLWSMFKATGCTPWNRTVASCKRPCCSALQPSAHQLHSISPKHLSCGTWSLLAATKAVLWLPSAPTVVQTPLPDIAALSVVAQRLQHMLVAQMAADGCFVTFPRGRILVKKAGSRIRSQILGHNVAQDATVLTVGTVASGPKFVVLFLGLVSGPDIGPAGAHNAAPEHSTGHGPTLSVSHCSAYEPVREKGVCPSRSAKAHNAGTHCRGESPSPKPPSLV